MLPAVLTVSVVKVGTVGVVLMFNVLVEVALLKLVTVLEPEWLTVPPALLVMPVMVFVLLILIVPVFVKLARAIVVVPAPDRLIVLALASVPAPDKVLVTANVPLLV